VDDAATAASGILPELRLLPALWAGGDTVPDISGLSVVSVVARIDRAVFGYLDSQQFMTARFVIRLLNAEGDLLSWCETNAQAKPQGRPRSTPFHAMGPSMFVIERDGLASNIAVHWCDLDVARLFALETPTAVSVGQVLRYDWFTMPVWMVEGSKVDVPLPPVTVRAKVTLSPPTGNLSAVAQ
jgi:hypothetical protein